MHYGKTKEKNILFDGNSSLQLNTESFQRNRIKFSSSIPKEECSDNGEGREKMLEMGKTTEILSSVPGEREETKEYPAKGNVEIEKRK